MSAVQVFTFTKIGVLGKRTWALSCINSIGLAFWAIWFILVHEHAIICAWHTYTYITFFIIVDLISIRSHLDNVFAITWMYWILQEAVQSRLKTRKTSSCFQAYTPSPLNDRSKMEFLHHFYPYCFLRNCPTSLAKISWTWEVICPSLNQAYCSSGKQP